MCPQKTRKMRPALLEKGIRDLSHCKHQASWSSALARLQLEPGHERFRAKRAILPGQEKHGRPCKVATHISGPLTCPAWIIGIPDIKKGLS